MHSGPAAHSGCCQTCWKYVLGQDSGQNSCCDTAATESCRTITGWLARVPGCILGLELTLAAVRHAGSMSWAKILDNIAAVTLLQLKAAEQLQAGWPESLDAVTI